jgi:hypothetical protein
MPITPSVQLFTQYRTYEQKPDALDQTRLDPEKKGKPLSDESWHQKLG